MDANHRPFNNLLYKGLTDTACVNHYLCRSFSNWMNRTKRGDVNFKNEQSPQEHLWRLTEESCLRKFVTAVALDEYMLKFQEDIESGIKKCETIHKCNFFRPDSIFSTEINVIRFSTDRGNLGLFCRHCFFGS
ncbi:MAG: hypothetical protein LBG96_11650 [Tannerella sp.]|jgi:hypothetical protein|nr:hypothetical protein [Tannerella sp.]